MRIAEPESVSESVNQQKDPREPTLVGALSIWSCWLPD
jgi:hypothetical protein